MQACVTEYPATEQDAILHDIKHLLINLLSKTALCHFGQKKKKKRQTSHTKLLLMLARYAGGVDFVLLFWYLSLFDKSKNRLKFVSLLRSSSLVSLGHRDLFINEPQVSESSF